MTGRSGTCRRNFEFSLISIKLQYYVDISVKYVIMGFVGVAFYSGFDCLVETCFSGGQFTHSSFLDRPNGGAVGQTDAIRDRLANMFRRNLKLSSVNLGCLLSIAMDHS